MMMTTTTMSTIEERAVEEITQRLSGLPDLHLPFALSSQGDSLTQADKKAHLLDLLHRDAAIFLERHGSRLSIRELQEFNVLNGDYEVDWHLKQLKSSLAPTTEKEQKARSNLVKNRRLAYMDILIQDGDFFSEDAMRMRDPLLYHEYLGQFQDPSERAFARPGERWSDMLIRQGEELEYQARLKTEREKAGIPVEQDEDEDNIEEEEEEEGEEEDDNGNEEEDLGNHDVGQKAMGVASSQKETTASEGSGGDRRAGTESRVLTFEEQQQLKLEDFSRYMQDKFIAGESSWKPSISSEELQCKMDDFTRIMQEKFLSGEDSEHFDYVRIDHDTALDDYWLEEMSQDAEDKYFEED